MLRLLFSFVIVVQFVQSIYVNFVETTSDNALTCGDKALSLSKHDFESPLQLWKFDPSNVLKSSSGKVLGYDSSTNSTLLQDVSGGGVEWSVDGFSVTATKGNIVLCLQSDVTKMGSCDGDIFKSLILVQDNSLSETLVKVAIDMDKYDSLMKQALINISNIEREIANSADLLSVTEHKLKNFTSTLFATYTTFTTSSASALGNLTVTQSRFQRHIDQLNTDIADLDILVKNVSSSINATTFNFTEIENKTNSLFADSQARLQSTLKFMQDEITLKSKQGHIVPNSIYDFIVIFLTLLGIINVADLFRRLWGCAVNGNDIKILYAQT